jgi:hypothetical protein
MGAYDAATRQFEAAERSDRDLKELFGVYAADGVPTIAQDRA